MTKQRWGTIHVLEARPRDSQGPSMKIGPEIGQVRCSTCRLRKMCVNVKGYEPEMLTHPRYCAGFRK